MYTRSVSYIRHKLIYICVTWKSMLSNNHKMTSNEISTDAPFRSDRGVLRCQAAAAPCACVRAGAALYAEMSTQR